jgi:hypothetical protein
MTRGGHEFSGGENPIFHEGSAGPIKALLSTNVQIDGTAMIDVITAIGSSEIHYFQIAAED